ncbi:MAG: hypothetical protein AB1714_10170 [Acidobacteriota bacterium]
MSTIKTGISIDRVLFDRANQTARDLKLSRSMLFSRAVTEFIERRQNRKLLDELNKAYADGPSEEERRIQNAMRKHHRRLVEGSW